MLKNFIPSFTWNEGAFIYNIAGIILILLVIFLMNLIIKKFYIKFERSKKHEHIYNIVIYALKIPTRILIWLLGLSYIIVLADKFLNFDILDTILLMRKIIFISLIIWFLLNLINQYERYSQKQDKSDTRTRLPIGTLCRVLKIMAVVFGLITVVETSGINISGLLAFGSIGGIVVGFASRDLLANFFGATLVYLDKPFEIGDWIRSPDKSIEGYVESISWRLTKIRTFDKRPLYVPNSIFNSIVIENASRMSHRRIKEIIGIRYADIKVIKKITNDIKVMLINHEEIDCTQTMIVSLVQFNDSSIDFMVYTFTTITGWTEYLRVKQDVLVKISEIIKANNAQIAFPTTTVHLEKHDSYIIDNMINRNSKVQKRK